MGTGNAYEPYRRSELLQLSFQDRQCLDGDFHRGIRALGYHDGMFVLSYHHQLAGSDFPSRYGDFGHQLRAIRVP